MTYKILGQGIYTGSGIYIYTVPDGKGAAISGVTVCNQTASSATFTINACKGGGSGADATNRIYYELPISSKDTFLTIPMSLSNEDQIFVEASVSGISFTVFGVEFDQANVYLP